MRAPIVTVSEQNRFDAGLLALRIGVAACAAGAVAQMPKQAPGAGSQTIPILILLASGCVAVGLLTRVVCSFGTVVSFWVAAALLYRGSEWYALPVRDALFGIAFAGIAIAGSGRFAVDRFFSSPEKTTKAPRPNVILSGDN